MTVGKFMALCYYGVGTALFVGYLVVLMFVR